MRSRMRWFAVVVLLGACYRHNPEVCCETDAECAVVGFETPQGCGEGPRPAGVCVNNQCVASGCDGDEDCQDPAAPHCISGACQSTCIFAGGRIAFTSNRDGDS